MKEYKWLVSRRDNSHPFMNPRHEAYTISVNGTPVGGVFKTTRGKAIAYLGSPDLPDVKAALLNSEYFRWADDIKTAVCELREKFPSGRKMTPEERKYNAALKQLNSLFKVA